MYTYEEMRAAYSKAWLNSYYNRLSVLLYDILRLEKNKIYQFSHVI